MLTTLVAYYGAKSPLLKELISSTNELLHSEFGTLFVPYSNEQVHATIVGLEHILVNSDRLNANFLTYRHSKKIIHLTGLIEHLKKTALLPMTIHMGGFSPDVNYGFTSQNQHPMLRSFSIQSTKVVAMGWPIQNKKITYQLAELRKSFEAFNILHKWHQQPIDIDNDFYFVLGILDRSKLDDAVINNVEKKIRHYFSEQTPLEITLQLNDLQLVAYSDLTLPTDSTHTLPLTEINDALSNLLGFIEL